MERRTLLKGSAALLISSPFAKTTMATTRKDLTVPPEEDPHERTFMQWPVSRQVHPDRFFLDILQHTIANIANTVSEFEPVIMLAARKDHKKARRQLSAKVTLWDIPTEDLWCRDSGPLFARRPDGSLAISHIKFNGWGAKQVHQHDGEVARKVAERLGLDLVSSGLKGEAGGVEHDGHSLLMAHESSWVNKNRNRGLTRNDIEARLLEAYGADRMIWSPGVWGKDITDYHIDSLARFTGPGRVLINLPDALDLKDPFHLAALETHDRLIEAGLHVDVIPEPAQKRVKSINFVASYANYYVCNGAVVAAEFGDRRADSLARKALKKHYPGREIITLDVDALGEVGGGIHCATQQMPRLNT